MSSSEIITKDHSNDYYTRLSDQATRSVDFRSITSVAHKCISNFPKRITEQQFIELSEKLTNQINTAKPLKPDGTLAKIGHWIASWKNPDTREAAEEAVAKLREQPKKNAEKFLECAEKLNGLHEKTDWLSNWRKTRLTKEITELTMYVLDKDTLSKDTASKITSTLFENYLEISQAFTTNQKAPEEKKEPVHGPEIAKKVPDISLALEPKLPPPIDTESIIAELQTAATLAAEAANLSKDARLKDLVDEAKLQADKARTQADLAASLYDKITESFPNPSSYTKATVLRKARSIYNETLNAAESAEHAATQAASFAKSQSERIAAARAKSPIAPLKDDIIEASPLLPPQKQASREASPTGPVQETAADRLQRKITEFTGKLISHTDDPIRLAATQILRKLNQNRDKYSEQKLDLVLLALNKIKNPNPQLVSDLLDCRNDQISLITKALNQTPTPLEFINKILKAPTTTIEVIQLATEQALLKDTIEKLLTLNEMQLNLISFALKAPSAIPAKIILDLIESPPPSSIIPLLESAFSKSRNTSSLQNVINSLRDLTETQIPLVEAATKATKTLREFEEALSRITSKGRSSPLQEAILPDLTGIAEQTKIKVQDLGTQAADLTDAAEETLKKASKLTSQGFSWLKNRTTGRDKK